MKDFTLYAFTKIADALHLNGTGRNQKKYFFKIETNALSRCGYHFHIIAVPCKYGRANAEAVAVRRFETLAGSYIPTWHLNIEEVQALTDDSIVEYAD